MYLLLYETQRAYYQVPRAPTSALDFFRGIIINYRSNQQRMRCYMIERTISISNIKRKIARLPEQFIEDPRAVTVTNHGKAVMVILPYDAYKLLSEAIEALYETLSTLQNEELMTAFREGIKVLINGETVAWEDVRKDLAWFGLLDIEDDGDT